MNLARNPLRSLSPPHDRAILPQLQEDGAGARPTVESNKRSRGSSGQKVLFSTAARQHRAGRRRRQMRQLNRSTALPMMSAKFTFFRLSRWEVSLLPRPNQAAGASPKGLRKVVAEV